MILPTKRLSDDRALLTVGAEVLRLLDEPKTVSRAWEDLKQVRASSYREPLAYDWFVLALDLLYTLKAVEFERGKLSRPR